MPKPIELVGGVLDRRPTWLQARWLRIAINYRTERWSDVVRLLTPIVNESTLDEHYAHAGEGDVGNRAGQAWHVRARPVLSGGARRAGGGGRRRRRTREGAGPARAG